MNGKGIAGVGVNRVNRRLVVKQFTESQLFQAWKCRCAHREALERRIGEQNINGGVKSA